MRSSNPKFFVIYETLELWKSKAYFGAFYTVYTAFKITKNETRV